MSGIVTFIGFLRFCVVYACYYTEMSRKLYCIQEELFGRKCSQKQYRTIERNRQCQRRCSDQVDDLESIISKAMSDKQRIMAAKQKLKANQERFNTSGCLLDKYRNDIENSELKNSAFANKQLLSLPDSPKVTRASFQKLLRTKSTSDEKDDDDKEKLHFFPPITQPGKELSKSGDFSPKLFHSPKLSRPNKAAKIEDADSLQGIDSWSPRSRRRGSECQNGLPKIIETRRVSLLNINAIQDMIKMRRGSTVVNIDTESSDILAPRHKNSDQDS